MRRSSHSGGAQDSVTVVHVVLVAGIAVRFR